MSIDVTDRQSGSAAQHATPGRLTIDNPIAEPQAHQENADRHAPAPRLDRLDGKTVALYWNGKQNGLDALARTKENLGRLFSDIVFIDVVGELGGTNRYLSAGQLEMLARDADAAVCSTADCGSCCSWLMRDLCELERRGVPAVGYTGRDLLRGRPLQHGDLRRPRGMPGHGARMLLQQDHRRDQPDGR